jgi:hypothetical protein
LPWARTTSIDPISSRAAGIDRGSVSVPAHVAQALSSARGPVVMHDDGTRGGVGVVGPSSCG